MTSIKGSVQAQEDIQFDWTVPKDEAQRRARIELGLQKCRDRYLDAIRDLDRTLIELEKEQGILERWFGYRTSV